MLATATFGAGCFWHVEEEFRTLPGVHATTVGFMGGHLPNPSYEQVCGHTTGHAEVCQVTFDPAEISYQQLLQVFWDCHDPTQLNRQGPDIGSQYRSVIFVHDGQQAAEARASLAAESRSPRYPRPLVTAIEPAGTFWPAEAYHQHYLARRRGLLPPA